MQWSKENRQKTKQLFTKQYTENKSSSNMNFSKIRGFEIFRFWHWNYKYFEYEVWLAFFCVRVPTHAQKLYDRKACLYTTYISYSNCLRQVIQLTWEVRRVLISDEYTSIPFQKYSIDFGRSLIAHPEVTSQNIVSLIAHGLLLIYKILSKIFIAY